MSQTTTAEPASAAENSPPRFDFPAWLPPMLVKELRQGLRTRGFVGGFIGVQALLLVVFLWSFAADATGGAWQQASEGFFWAIMGAVLLISPPVRALGALGPEIELRTMDLLLLTRLDARRIVWGKWTSLQIQTLLLLATILPYAVVRYFFGSVDLVQDFGVIAAMLAGGALFSGVALWASGLPKVVRVFAIFMMVITGFNVFGFGFARAMMGGGLGAGGAASVWLAMALGVWSGFVLLAYSLTLAVRWFAPPAENHAGLPRLVPFALALPIPFLTWAGQHVLLAGQIAAAISITAFAAAVELSSSREPMRVHLRGWMSRGPGREWLGMLALPGWPSAAAWLGAVLSLFGAAWWITDLCTPADLHAARVLWLLALGWAGLVFPILPISLLPSARKTAGALYFTLHALLGIFAIVAGNESLGRLAPAFMSALDWVSQAVPASGFWRALAEFNKPGGLPGAWIGRGIGFVLTLGLTLALSRGYWANVRLMRTRVHREE